MGLSFEYSLRKIPNNYQFKKEYLDKNSDSIKVLFLGSSHAMFSINPQYISNKSFNDGHNSQTLDYDFEILKKYSNNWKNLDFIAISISDFTLYKKVGIMDPSKIKNYTIYYGFKTSWKISENSELLSVKGLTNLKRFYSYYVRNRSEVSCTDLGFSFFSDPTIKFDLVETGKINASYHASKDDRYFNENLRTLKSIVEFTRERGIRLFLYTAPAYQTYVRNLDSKKLQRTINTLSDIENKYDHVVYRNFLTDNSFRANDFSNADHLNKIGAKKFTLTIDSLINQNKQFISRKSNPLPR
jgi:hypothetical protein